MILEAHVQTLMGQPFNGVLKTSILDGMVCLRNSIICGLWIWGIGLVIWKLGLRPSFILNETSFSSLDLDDGALDLWVHGPLMNCVGYETILEFDVCTWGNSLAIAWMNPGWWLLDIDSARDWLLVNCIVCGLGFRGIEIVILQLGLQPIRH